MTTLTGKTIQSTFKDLLQVSNTNQGIDTSVRVVSDGEGTASEFFLSTTIARIGAAGTLDFASGGKFDPTNMAAITGTWADLGTVTTAIFTSADINGGTMDDVVIGAVTAVDATFLDAFVNTVQATEFLQTDVRTSAPAGLENGIIAVADGSTYDPLNFGLGPYYFGQLSGVLEPLSSVKTTFQTTDATPTVVASIPVASGSIVGVYGRLTAKKSGALDRLIWDFQTSAVNIGGTTTVGANPTVGGTGSIVGTADGLSLDAVADDTNDELDLTFTGIVSETWDVTVTYMVEVES